MDRLRQSPRNWLLLLLLVAGGLYQGRMLLAGMYRELSAVRGAIGQDGLWRSAYFYQNDRFADFVQFIHENTPADAQIVLPPPDIGPRALGITPAMQFFLAPRQVSNCLDLDCQKNISSPNTYLVIMDPAQAAPQDLGMRQLRMFDHDWGLIIPAHPQPGNPDAMAGFSSLAEILPFAFWPGLWLASLIFCGLLITQRLAPELAFPFKASLGYGLALGSYTLLVCLASLVGLTLNRALLLGLTGLLLLLSIGIFLLLKKSKPVNDLPTPAESSPRISLDPWLLCLLFLGGIAALISVGKGYHTTDEVLLWGAKGYGIASAGTVRSVTDWGTNTVPYPLHIPLLIASFRVLFSGSLLFSEALPASKLVFAGYYLGLLLTAYYTLIRMEVRHFVAGLGTLFLASIPLIFRHATIAYANLTLSYYLITAVCTLALSFETRSSRGALRLALLSGLFFALAAWTRPEGLILSWACIGLVLGLAHLRKWEPFSLRKTLFLIAPLVLYGLFWWLVKFAVYSRPAGWPSLASTTAAQIVRGNLHLNEAVYLLQAFVVRLASTKAWGVMGAGLFLFLIAALAFPSRPKKASTVLIGSGVLCGVLIFGIYYLTSFDGGHDLSWWVSTGLDRMLIPAITLLWLGILSRAQLFNHGK